MNGSAMIDNLWRDVRFSLRTMLRRPAATAITLLTIALGIGATTAIFSLVNAVLADPGRRARQPELSRPSRFH
jgi:putative ABC transport system permease protein